MTTPVQTPTKTYPDVVEAGRVIGTLDPTDTALFVLVFIIFVMVIERGIAGWQMSLERKAMRELARQFGDSSDKVADALYALKTEFTAARMVASRMEAAAGERAEHSKDAG